MQKLTSQNYVEIAENVIKGLSQKTNQKTGRPIGMVTTSKIRNILAMTADIYNEVILSEKEDLDEKICERIEYLKVRILYEYGRDDRDGKVKDFINESNLLGYLNQIDRKKSNYILFSRYMEALVAYHKYYGGKDW